MEFKVIKLDRKRNNVVLSRRAVVEPRWAKSAQLLETLQEGAIVHGVVKNITEYGAFVDLGGIDGLLHITDMAWRRVRHPSEGGARSARTDGQGAQVRRREEPRLAGHQAAGRRPVERRVAPLPEQHPPVRQGHQHRRLRRVRRDRAGHRGLVHVSEMDWTNKNVAPAKVVSPLGDEVEVMVLEIDEDKRRISLGMKQCKPTRGRSSPPTSTAATRSGPDQVDHRLRRVRRPGRRHRRPGAPVRPVLARAGRAAVRNYRRARKRGHRAGHRRGARAHQPGHQAARR